MESLMQPDRLRARILLWVEEEIRLSALPPKSGNILEAVLYRGELPRGDAAGVVGTGERHARRIVSALIERGVLASESPRAPLRLVFPATLASRWMPGLFPEKVNVREQHALKFPTPEGREDSERDVIVSGGRMEKPASVATWAGELWTITSAGTTRTSSKYSAGTVRASKGKLGGNISPAAQNLTGLFSSARVTCSAVRCALFVRGLKAV